MTLHCLRWMTMLAAAGALAGCAGTAPLPAFDPGTPLDAVRQAGRQPSDDRALPDGGRELEYGGGQFGKQTWLLRFDAQGRLQSREQVRDDAHFNALRAGMTADEVRRRIGPPSETWTVARPPEQVWAFRYDPPGGDCRWFLVGIGASGQVLDTGYAEDPMCVVAQ